MSLRHRIAFPFPFYPHNNLVREAEKMLLANTTSWIHCISGLIYTCYLLLFKSWFHCPLIQTNFTDLDGIIIGNSNQSVPFPFHFSIIFPQELGFSFYSRSSRLAIPICSLVSRKPGSSERCVPLECLCHQLSCQLREWLPHHSWFLVPFSNVHV